MRHITRDHSERFSCNQFPRKRPLHQPLAQPIDLAARCRLLIANPLHTLNETDELL